MCSFHFSFPQNSPVRSWGEKRKFLPLLVGTAAQCISLVTVSSHNYHYSWRLLLQRLLWLHHYKSLIPVKNDQITHLCMNCVMIPKADISTPANFPLIGWIFFFVQSYLIHQLRLATGKVTCDSSFTVGLGHTQKKKLYLAEKYYGDLNGQKVIIHLECHEDASWLWKKKLLSVRVRSLEIPKFSARLKEKFLFFCSVNGLNWLSKGSGKHHSWCSAGGWSVRTAGEKGTKRTVLPGSVC